MSTKTCGDDKHHIIFVGEGFDLKRGCGGDLSSRSSLARVSGSVGKGWWQL